MVDRKLNERIQDEIDMRPVPYTYRHICADYEEYLDLKSEYSKPEYWVREEEDYYEEEEL